MKAIHKIIIIGGIVAAPALTSCDGAGQGTTGDNVISFAELNASRAYILEGSAEDFMRDSDLVCYDSVSIMIPTAIKGLNISELQDSILSAAFDTISDDHTAAMNRYLDAQASNMGYTAKAISRDSVAINLYDADGYTLITGEVVSMTGAMLTYSVTNSSYSPGAAHGMTHRLYLNFSLSDGKVIKLGDLFTAEGLKALPGVIQSQADKMTSTLGITSITELPAYDNFFITAAGDIVFAFQPYEVASYAQGEVKVPFYAYELAQYMTPYGLKIFNMQGIEGL